MLKWHHKSILLPKFYDQILRNLEQRSILIYIEEGNECRSSMANLTNLLTFLYSKNRYFPKGGGHCKISVKPINYLNPVQMVDFGEVSKFFGWSFVAGSLPVKVCEFTVIIVILLQISLIQSASG